MGYFANGTEGEIFIARYCSKCAHYSGDESVYGCPVWDAHLLANYDQGENDDLALVLDILIPRDGTSNAKCAMFINVGRNGSNR